MPYTVPANNAVDFALTVYTVPANNAVNFEYASGPVDYPMNAVPGAYTISGLAATPLAARIINAALSSYTLTPPAATLLSARMVNAVPSSYTVSPPDATLLAARQLNAVLATYGITGSDAGLSRGFILVADGDSYTIAGFDATLVYTPVAGIEFNAEAGSYTISGLAGTLLADRVLSTVPDIYTISGANAETLAGRVLAADPTSYLVSGANIEAVIGRVLAALAGSYDISGTDLEFVKGLLMNAEAGSYVITGQLAKALLEVDMIVGVADSVAGIALNKRAEIVDALIGNVISGDYLTTWNNDGDYYQVSDDTGEIDVRIEFNVGDGIPTGAVIIGSCTGVNDNLNIYVYNWVTSDWGYFATLTGKNSPSNIEIPLTLFITNVGTGTDKGRVIVKLQNTGLSSANLYLDQIYVNYSLAGAVTEQDKIDIADLVLAQALTVGKFIALK